MKMLTARHEEQHLTGNEEEEAINIPNCEDTRWDFLSGWGDPLAASPEDDAPPPGEKRS